MMIVVVVACRQIHAMGFPAERVVRTCKTLGEDSQKIIHFCLLVDQLVETEKFPEEEVSKRPSLFIFFNSLPSSKFLPFTNLYSSTNLSQRISTQTIVMKPIPTIRQTPTTIPNWSKALMVCSPGIFKTVKQKLVEF